MIRSGKVGLTATVILMLSIVLFIGSLFWLYVNGPWSGSGNNLFNPASNKPPSETEKNTGTPIIETVSLSDAIDELEEAGVSCIVFNEDIDTQTAQHVNYQDFKELAIEKKLVLIISIDDNECLLTYQNKNKIIWKP